MNDSREATNSTWGTKKKTAVIIGGGPAGLTAAYELLTRTDIHPIIIESEQVVGGLSRTLDFKGNRIDIGPHRFFSKSDRVMQWWYAMLPLQKVPEGMQTTIAYHGKTRSVEGVASAPDPDTEDAVLLLRPRKTRMYFLRKFFNYPIDLSLPTLRMLGLVRSIRIAFSYLRVVVFPITPVKNLEDFYINRFGRELYKTFFETYTHKLWGIPCRDISAEWGAQRVKGVSITAVITDFFRRAFGKKKGIGQKGTETSLIEQFLYPKLGAGQMWETAAERVRTLGGEIHLSCRVEKILSTGNRVTGVEALFSDGSRREIAAEYVFSTMPVAGLVRGLGDVVPQEIRDIALNLSYRDFVMVGVLVKDLAQHEPEGGIIRDNWLYIQERNVQIARIQICNNMSPYLVKDPNTVLLGLEYFCNKDDVTWNKPDADMIALAVDELVSMDLIRRDDVLDAFVTRVPKILPVYFGAYDHFSNVQEYLNTFENLFPIGRNGMHKYNNQDHSMLCAMIAVDNILAGKTDKKNLWEINTEMEYHEEKKGE